MKDRWRKGVDRFLQGKTTVLFIASFLLILLITLISILVAHFMMARITEVTADNLLSKQDFVSASIYDGLVKAPNLLSIGITESKLHDEIYISSLLRKMKSSLSNINSIWFLFLDEYGVVTETVSDLNYWAVPDHLYDFNDAEQIIYNADTIISIGDAYRDSMDVATIQPIFITFYHGMIPVAVLFIEVNLSRLFFDAYGSNDFISEQYSVSVYSKQRKLLDTSENYRVIKASVLDAAPLMQPLNKQEKLTLHTDSQFYKISNDFIELYNVSPMGYIVYGRLPYAYIHSIVKPIILMIIGIGIVAFIILLVLGSISLLYRQMREDEVRLQIETIQAKLDPHFLFNTLNSMVGLAMEKNDKLIEAFQSLSIFLRSSINVSTYVTLFDELEYIQSYIDIQKIRYGDLFEYHCEIQDEALCQMTIPRFSIQPIIENCFVHAVALADKRSLIHINLSAKVLKKMLVLDIENDGPSSEVDINRIQSILDSKKEQSENGRIGLAIINRELKLMYGKKYGLGLIRRKPDSFAIRIKLPAHSFDGSCVTQIIE